MDTNPLAVASRVVFAAGLGALVLAGCSDDPPPPKPVAKAPAPAASPAPKAEDKPAPAAKPADAGGAADRALAARVKEALLADKGLNAHGIDVGAKNGTVTLFGTVENKTRLEQAAKIAAAVDGARSVENKLVVVSGS